MESKQLGQAGVNESAENSPQVIPIDRIQMHEYPAVRPGVIQRLSVAVSVSIAMSAALGTVVWLIVRR